jgi:hypothetical protein
VGTHAVTLPKELPKLEGMREPVQWLSPVEAFNLAQIAQYPDSLSPDDPAHLRAEFMPKELMRLRGPAFRIGREIWRAKTNGRIPGSPNDAVFDEGELKRCGGWATHREIETARQIMTWHKTNLVSERYQRSDSKPRPTQEKPRASFGIKEDSHTLLQSEGKQPQSSEDTSC